MKKGFTLIEVLVAVTIIAVLVSIGVVSYASVNKRSRDAKRRGDIEQLRSALEMYRADIGSYPNLGGGSWVDASGLDISGTNPTDDLVPTYTPAIPSDPKTTPKYRYIATSPSGGKYYGYCLETNLETEAGSNTCSGVTLETGYNYGAKSP